MKISIEGSGLLAPGAMKAWVRRQKDRIDGATRQGLFDARGRAEQVLKAETRKAFKITPASGGRFERTWRLRVVTSRHGHGLSMWNVAPWLKIHTTGGMIAARNGRALLIPINTRLGTRLTAKKFQKLIDWLMQEKLTVIKGGILYAKPLMNTSRRGGVAAGSRVNKRFRTRFQGSKRRPSGFDIRLNDEGLTPIAIIRTSFQMRKRLDLEGLARQRILSIVAESVRARLAQSGR